MKDLFIDQNIIGNYVLDSSIDPLVKDFKKHLPEDELGAVPTEVKMCVDAVANVEKLEPSETQDEIDCFEITKNSDNFNFNTSCLNIDLVDEIHCQELKGRKKPRTNEKFPVKKPARNNARKKEDLSRCLLCDSRFGSFSKLLNHITSVHFQSEVTLTNKVRTTLAMSSHHGS